MNDPLLIESVYKILFSLLTGAILGFERELRRKPAGIRTITLLCAGSALFTILSIQIGYPGNMDRVASNILTGVGFIGAGVIFKGEFSIDGITTATTIWIAAALGMAIGMDKYWLAGITLTSALVVLRVLQYVEDWITRTRERKMYTVMYKNEDMTEADILAIFQQFHLQHKKVATMRKESIVEEKYEISGPIKNMEAMNRSLMVNPLIHSFIVQVNI
ncbi:MgtC/SapB family protein [Chitinophaga caeni]|uniref:MgtC/SapB family protein n=1 Tax=Chitinophaga caeni TaxID=2029983 RepID=UPI0018E090BF|nr:MgtC/SapB family protein [Chitinophaga caeni]